MSKIFNKNNVKVSDCYGGGEEERINSLNRKLPTDINAKEGRPRCNCRIKIISPMEGNCLVKNIVSG